MIKLKTQTRIYALGMLLLWLSVVIIMIMSIATFFNSIKMSSIVKNLDENIQKQQQQIDQLEKMYKDLENKFFGAKGTFSLSSMLYLNQSQYGNNLSLYGQDRLRLMEEIYDSAIEFEVDPHLAFCIITVESAWDTDAKSEAGAIGLMGIMPSTARLMERTIKTGELYDPFRNVVLGVQWFGKLRILNANNNVAALNEYWCGNGIENNTAYSSKVLGLTKKMKEGKL